MVSIMQVVSRIHFEKPKPEPPPFIRVIAREEKTGKSKALTLYHITPEEFIAWLRGIGGPPRKKE